jgi:hypothetical protein
MWPSRIWTERAFYKDTLGLKPIDEQDGELIVFKSGSSSLNVYRSQYAGTNKATAVTWTVDDVGDTVRSRPKEGSGREYPQCGQRGVDVLTIRTRLAVA